MRFILIIALVLASVTVNAAEGRRTAALGGFAFGAVAGFLVRDAIVEAPRRERVVYVEREAAPVEREVIVYREVPPPRTVIVVVEGRGHRLHPINGNGMGWHPAPVRPFPQ